MSEPNRARAFYDVLITRNPDGSTEGRNPNDLPKELLHEAFKKTSLLKVLRDKCIECCCHQFGEVRKCTAVGCPLWPYRLGKNPFSNRKGNPASLPNHPPSAVNSESSAEGHPGSKKPRSAEKLSPRARNSTAAPQAATPRRRSRTT
jgi:hypothetical protein